MNRSVDHTSKPPLDAQRDFDYQQAVIREANELQTKHPKGLSDDVVSDALREAGVQLEQGKLVFSSFDQVRELHRNLLSATGQYHERELLTFMEGLSENEIVELKLRLRGVYAIGPLVNGVPEFGWRIFQNLPPILADASDTLERVIDGASTAIAAHHRLEKQLHDAAMAAITALNDAVATYAPELCDDARVAAARSRIAANGGTLAYLADAISGLTHATSGMPAVAP